MSATNIQLLCSLCLITDAEVNRGEQLTTELKACPDIIEELDSPQGGVIFILLERIKLYDFTSLC